MQWKYPYMSLMGMYIHVTTVEISLDVTQKTTNSTVSLDYAIFDYMPKGI